MHEFIFDTKFYQVIILNDDPEGFNWGVLNKEYECIEHKCMTQGNAVAVCMALTSQLEDLMSTNMASVVEFPRETAH